MAYEKTLVLLKPDAVRRKLAGRIISRFEDAGLDILALRVWNTADKTLISEHYQSTDTWLRGVGEKTLQSYRENGRTEDDVRRDFGTSEPNEIGKVVKTRLIRFMTAGPLIAMILGGNGAIAKVRKLVGHTIPASAAPGTIRGDFSCDSPEIATSEDRSVENLVHASGNREEADFEIKLWFGQK